MGVCIMRKNSPPDLTQTDLPTGLRKICAKSQVCLGPVRNNTRQDKKTLTRF
jgi:hypothetical protein